jgi:ABC-type multidrug transport system fused ATPase/permease subunit
LTTGVREVELGLGVGLLGGARAIAQLVPLAIALAWLAPKLALVALLVFAPFSMLLSRTRKRWKQAHARAAREGELLLESADEAVRLADLWTTYGAEGKARATVKALGEAIGRQSARLEASAAALSATNEILGAVALIAALGAARAGLLGDAGSGGTLLSFTVAFFLAYRPLRDFTEARLAWARASAAFDELSKIALPDASGPDGVQPQPAGRTDPAAGAGWPLAQLELNNVRLARGAGLPLSMSIPPGQIVAVLGPTGAGKTTLLRTLLGLETALGGDIRYDGASLDAAPPGLVGRPFAWVPQESPLLADTIEANVSLGSAGPPSSRRSREALEELGAGHLADELGTSRLGAGGRAVSGGERQWIALARAIATRQPILLLDEPTSGLDGQAQQRVLDAIAGLRGKRSVVLVTHRTEPLAIADHVIRVPG